MTNIKTDSEDDDHNSFVIQGDVWSATAITNMNASEDFSTKKTTRIEFFIGDAKKEYICKTDEEAEEARVAENKWKAYNNIT